MNTTRNVERMAPQPLYLQIKEALKERILDGTYRPHDKLPSENELMSQFGVSRITVRQALRDLTGEGLLFSAQGKGTFVSKPKAVQDVRRLEGFEEAMTRKGYDTSSRLLGIQELRPSLQIRQALQLQARVPCIEVRRVRYLNREPVSVDLSYFPVEIGRQLFSRDLTGDIFPLLENQLGIPLGAADISLEAALVDEDMAKLLSMEPGEAVMRVERLTFDRRNQPIDFEYLTFRGDAYRYRFRNERQ